MQPGVPADESALPPWNVESVAPVVIEEPATRYEPFAFTGSGAEYFRIWIVNLVLSVATLGIYSAWAKVRRLEYFYRHTRVSGAGFDYHGKPLAILKGRILAFLLFGSYYVAGYLSPALGVAVAILLAALLPWLLVRSMRFRLYNSSYRGLRFHFHGTTREAYRVFLALPLISAASFFTLVPLLHHQLKRFQHSNAAYGQTRFSFDGRISAFYRVYLFIGLCLMMFVLAMGIVLTLFLGPGLMSGDTGAEPSMRQMGLIAGGIIVYALGMALFWSLMTAQIRNLVWRHTALGPHRFISTLEVHKLLAIVVTNVLGVVFTLGLFRPYAEIRLAKYIIGELALVSSGRLDEFVAGAQPETTALGEEAAELLDVDFGI
jgi:uncharacterized membrane protein YjgN (DUF898 family)